MVIYHQKIPDYIFAKIREIILKLYNNGILYPDITGYNFIEHKSNGKVYILDFEHVTYVDQGENDFVTKFLNGYDGWNPDFFVNDINFSYHHNRF